MSDVTALIKLNVPVFDQDPWDDDVNENWQIIDALIGKFTAIPNLVGVWQNATAYTSGQNAIDPFDGSIWSCIQAHTSSVAPTTFAQERVSFPVRWGATDPGAQYYAQQAAASAAAAANSAAAAAASAASISAGVPLHGGTMTGPLILSADPTVALGAATKQYVDGKVGGVNYLPITGGVLSGELTVGGHGIKWSDQATNMHTMSFGWNGSAIVANVDGTGIGALATQSYVSGGFLPLGGGSLSGGLNVAGELHTPTVLRLTNSGAYFYTDATYTSIAWDNVGWLLRYTRSNGTLNYLNGSGTDLFQLDGSGNVYNSGNHQSAGNIIVGGNLYARGGSAFVGAADRSRFTSDNSTYSELLFLDSYGWYFNWSNGIVAWHRYDGLAVVTITPAGDVGMTGQFSATGAVSSGSNVVATGTLYAASQNMQFGVGGAGRIMQFNPGVYWEWNSSTNQVYLVGASSLAGTERKVGIFDLADRIAALEARLGTATDRTEHTTGSDVDC